MLDVGLDTSTASALLSALGLAREHGSAEAALAAAGIDLPEALRLEASASDLGALNNDGSGSEALALGFLAGRVAQRPRARTRRVLPDPTAFVMDRDLVVQTAEGESILRLPWFEDGLFVGRQLPDISEMPTRVRALAVESYRAALAGERRRYSFTSYGHAYSVDAVPVPGDSGSIQAVLAIATPDHSFASAATAYERVAERLDRHATLAQERAERHRLAGRSDAEAATRRAAQKTHEAAERARSNAGRLRFRHAAAAPADPPRLTPRELEVLSLASHGLTYAETAEQLAVTVATVRTHLKNIYPKLGASDKAAAVAAALRHGLIE
jgi:DNA-binding CsgD family transcriptional regulator